MIGLGPRVGSKESKRPIHEKDEEQVILKNKADAIKAVDEMNASVTQEQPTKQSQEGSQRGHESLDEIKIDDEDITA